jgi:hypothetical protein
MKGVRIAPALRGTVAMLLYVTITAMVVNGSQCRAQAAAPQGEEVSEGQKRNAEIQKLNSEAATLWLTPLVTAFRSSWPQVELSGRQEPPLATAKRMQKTRPP